MAAIGLGGTSRCDVERGVGPVDAGGVERRLVDDRRQAVLDRRADQRREAAGRHSSPAWRASFDVAFVLPQLGGEHVPTVLVGEDVVQVEHCVGFGSSAQIGSPAGGFGAGLSAAWIDARPGAAIGRRGQTGRR
jgi:hypothetical protein